MCLKKMKTGIYATPAVEGLSCYSLFHQIPEVDFFQFARSLLKNIQVLFSSSPHISDNLVDFFVYFIIIIIVDFL